MSDMDDETFGRAWAKQQGIEPAPGGNGRCLWLDQHCVGAGERNKLLLQVKAEQNHNQRLMMAYAITRSAAERGQGHAYMGTATDMDTDVAKDAHDAIKVLPARGDELVLPLVKGEE